MACPYCQGDAAQELERTTALGYRLSRCRPCRRTVNERTGTPFNRLHVPTDSALLVVLWRLRYKLSLRDLAEMFLTRGFTFTHETVREWEARFAPLLAERLRAKRRGKAGVKWQCDETYVKVYGRWCYLYRASDADGSLVDSMLSETRDMEAAKRFFARARTVVGHAPETVTTDGHDAYPRAILCRTAPQCIDPRHAFMRRKERCTRDGALQSRFCLQLIAHSVRYEALRLEKTALCHSRARSRVDRADTRGWTTGAMRAYLASGNDQAVG